MSAFVEIAVNVPQVRGVFHYHLPLELQGRLQPGHFVLVPFGRQTVQGVVLELIDQPSVPKTRPVKTLLDPRPVLTRQQIELARYLSQHSLTPLAACVDLMLPPGLSQHVETIYSLPEGAGAAAWPADLGRTELRLLQLLERRGPLRTSQVGRALPRQNWQAAARALARQSLIQMETMLPAPAVRPKVVRTARLACAPQAARAAMDDLGRAGTKARARRQKMLQFLIDETGPVEVSWVYAASGGSLADLRYLAERDLISLGEDEVWRDPLEGVAPPPVEPVLLTREQQAAWVQIQAALAPGAASAPFLLHGVTGSGKTELYLKAVEAVLSQGRQAIVLVPEIALTPQTVRRFIGRFPGQVGLVHSRLSAGERYDTWRRARSGLLSVVVGPRSALFTPFPELGLIVLDESHDESYYQSDPPAFHARELAVTYARLAGAACLLGTATPDVTSYYRAREGRWHLIHLPERILGHRKAIHAQAEHFGITSKFRPLEGEAETIDLPPVQVVDMRAELHAGNRSIFSQALQSALGEVLRRGEQAILFLNRRGSATYVFCRDCGYVLKCPRCDLPLTYHAAEDGLLCHYCGYRRRLPATCPECGSQRIRRYGSGTEKVEQEVQALFPQAHTLRWDRSTTGTKGAHEAILSSFANHRADVLVGTQMLAKGLDLPLVTLVGVVLADVGLTLPDYRAAERVFQVLTQVAGRAGRSPLGGRVILQTFQPEHYAIQAAAGHDFPAFYDRELGYRRELGYPPFARLVRLELRDQQADRVEQQARALAAALHAGIQREPRRTLELVGPVPCFFARIGGIYRWQIVLRGRDPVGFLQAWLAAGQDLDAVRVEANPPSLL
ncbi:MAG: primosomal protein N' [Anaerolineales bacterium]|jgi:primosomal protein N' (replication factor Y)